MIGRLRGEIAIKQPPYLLLEVNGVGYELEAPMSTFYDLPAVGESVQIYTHLQVREDAHTLYAFSNETQRSLFRALLKVNGVGAKMALAILSGMNPEEFHRSVEEGDAKSLTRLPGVGKKTAERLIIEMRDRLKTLFGDAPAILGAPQAQANQADEAVQALVALGYKPAEASKLVNAVEAEGKDSEVIIREALKATLK
jgi:Holliday junction DNA helicase RuvA